VAVLLVSPEAMAQSRAQYDSMVASHARANNVPEALVHRVIVRESKYHPSLVGRGGTIGLMQIKLPTARGLGYTGDAAGLRDPDTNLAWGIKYLAGAYRAANGDHGRAMRYYASGYYYAAKRQRRSGQMAGPVLASDAPPKIIARPVQAASAEAKRQTSNSGFGRFSSVRAQRRCSSRKAALTPPQLLHYLFRCSDELRYRKRAVHPGPR
jgi:hypothetical protein